MAGFLIYSLVIIGLGCWPKLHLPTGFSGIGLRLLLGFATTLILGFLLLIIGLKISTTATVIAILASAGIINRLRAHNWSAKTLISLFHPGVVFFALGFMITVIRSDLNYLPVGGDEFSTWLANPLHLHTNETFRDALTAFHMPGYLPGWPLILSLPWQFSGEVNFGHSAVAPFVFCAAVMAFVFDIVTNVLKKHFRLGGPQAMLFGWTFVLAFSAVQAIGPLWSRTLLIEAPQTYSAVAFLLVLYASTLARSHHSVFEWSAGVILSAAYLIKSAAVLFAPGILLLCLIDFFLKSKNQGYPALNSLSRAFRLLSPLVLVVTVWALFHEKHSCLTQPLLTFSPDALSKAVTYDWIDLAHRLVNEVGNYILDYKFIITVFSTSALAIALLSSQKYVSIVFFSMSFFYLSALYWFHLSCFGDYYFKELNSIPRFTRVIIWILHAVGLVMLVEVVCKIARSLKFQQLIEAFLRKKSVLIASGLVLFALTLNQTMSVWRSTEDITTRKYQKLDERIIESANAAQTVRALSGILLPRHPKLLIISQNLNSTVLSHAYFYSLSRQRGMPNPTFSIIPENSWAPVPKNIWQLKADQNIFRNTLLQADIVWPMQVDDWLVAAINPFVNDGSCLAGLEKHFLIASRSIDGSKIFLCQPKNNI